MAHSNGIALRDLNTLSRTHYWRDEIRADFGTKRRARRNARAKLTVDTRRIVANALYR